MRNSDTSIVIHEEPTAINPHDNTMRTVVFYQKNNYTTRPRGYYLRTFSLKIDGQWETIRMSVFGSAGGGFNQESILEPANRFNRKKLEQLAAHQKSLINQPAAA